MITLALVVLSLWLLVSFVGQVLTSAQMDRRTAEVESEIATIESENQHLATAVAYAESPAYAEQIARDQLGYAHDGDTVLLPVLPQNTPAPVSPTPTPLPTPVPQPNWRGWVDAFLAPPTVP